VKSIYLPTINVQQYNWLQTKTLAVFRVGWAVQAPKLHCCCGQQSCKQR